MNEIEKIGHSVKKLEDNFSKLDTTLSSKESRDFFLVQQIKFQIDLLKKMTLTDEQIKEFDKKLEDYVKSSHFY